MIVCPLCNGEEYNLVQSLSFSDLSDLYRRNLGISIKKEKIKTIKYCECKTCGLKYFSPFVAGDGDFYDSLNKKFSWYYADEKDEYKIIAKYIKSSDKILEIGCGEGKFFGYLKNKLKKNPEYQGVDINKEAINLGKKKGLKLINDSIENFSTQKRHFDVVLSVQVMEHVTNLREYVVSAFKCVKKGGILILSVPSDDSFVGKSLNSTLNFPPHHQTRWSDSTLKYIANILETNKPKIIHESISKAHADWYYREMLLSYSFKNKNGYIFTKKNQYKIAKLFFYIPSLILSRIFKPSNNIYGHSVIAIYKKS